MYEFFVDLDIRLLLFVNSLHTDFLDEVMWIITKAATWIPLYIAILTYLFYRNKWKIGLLMTLAIALSVGLSDLISVECFKNVFCRLRPTHNLITKDLVHIVHDYRGGLYGFVSSHAANMFAIATATSLFIAKRWFTIAIFVWAAIICYSRMYVAAHFPFDLLCGAILGTLVAFAINRLYQIICNKWFVCNSTDNQ